MNTITAQIQDLMDNVKTMKKTPGVDVKALNKTLARLEEAWLWSQHVVRVEAVTTTPPPSSVWPSGTMPSSGHTVAAKPTTSACICPTGAVDGTCPIHGLK